MKKITAEEVRSVSDVIKIALTDQEISAYADHINDILKGAEQLINTDTTGVEPVFSPLTGSLPVREDKVVKSLTQEEALSAAKYKEHGHFKVPKTIDG